MLTTFPALTKRDCHQHISQVTQLQSHFNPVISASLPEDRYFVKRVNVAIVVMG